MPEAERRATLHLLCGLPGAGKTTLARQIESSTPAVRFCPDEWIASLLDDPTDRDENERLRPLVESLQWETARRLLVLGRDVILENGFWGRSERESLRNEAQALGAHVTLHLLDLPEAALWKRLEQRNRRRPEATFEVSREELARWMNWFQRPEADELSGYDSHEIH